MMYTVCETEIFVGLVEKIWTDEEREEFIDWLSEHPLEGDVIPGTGSLRKVRWMAKGKGTRGGARVIYCNKLEQGKIFLLMIYTKDKFENLPISFYKKLRELMNE